MTTQEQELTLFGGWAKVQTLRQIGTGVVKPSVTHSASIFIREGTSECEMLRELFSVDYQFPKIHRFELHTSAYSYDLSPTLTERFFSPESHLRVEMEPNILQQAESNLFPYTYFDIEIERAFMRPSHDVKKYVEDFEVIDPEINPHWEGAFLDTWLSRLFLRFFEIWIKGTSETIERGCAAKPPLKRSLSGMIGGNFNGGFADMMKPLTRLASGEWTLSHARPLYPHIPRLPSKGIKNARQLAYKLAEQRQQTTQ